MRRRYNVRVSDNGPTPDPHRRDPMEHTKRRAYTLETTGLLIIALLILLLTITRYWHNIHWSVR